MFVIYNDKNIDEVMAQQTGIVTPVRKRKTVEGNSSAQDFAFTAKSVRIHELWNESAPSPQGEL